MSDPSSNPRAADAAATLVDLLRAQAAAQGDALAFTFLEDGRTESGRTDYAALDADARRIAGWLQADHAPGERALLLFPAGLDFVRAFFGCLYAGLIPIPAPAPEASRRKRTMPRLRSIVRDAEVTLTLSTGDALALVRDAGRDVPELEAVPVRDPAEAPGEAAAAWRAPEIAPDAIAYLQYTSGSTTDPKGVMLTHANVLHHCRDLRAGCGYGPDSVSVTWLPYFHDYGLIEGVITPVQNGTPCHIMSPFSFLKRPFAWLNAMSRLGGTHTQGPNFAYDQCVRRVRPDQRAGLDLSHVVSMGNGAEPVNPAVVEAFHAAFAETGLKREALCPAYGLAEATLMMSCRGPDQAPRYGRFDAAALTDRKIVPVPDAADGEGERTRLITSCGAPLGAIEIAIVDPDAKRRCAPDEIGEVWIADPCVAVGYWRRPEATEETFRARIADTGEGPFLRTGDLGFLWEGELYLTSRIKDLIIVAGANHYPQDIEWTVEGCHPAVRPGHVAATAVAVRGEERLLVAPEVERGALADAAAREELLSAIRRAISEQHEVQVHAVLILQRASLPKTASGKIQRHVCERFLRDMGPEVIAAWTADGGWIERKTEPAAAAAAEQG